MLAINLKKEVRKLGIKNARFHDLRRTFGLNLIKQGMSVYKVSKLLGHKSVRTTEQHYAPLTVEIEDFYFVRCLVISNRIFLTDNW